MNAGGTEPRLVHTRAEVREWRDDSRRRGRPVALVPTMGALHAGHASLIGIARDNGWKVAVSIFVNPLQFGTGEDLDRYPRDLDRDLALAAGAGADLVFAPTVAEMYTAGDPGVAVTPTRGEDVLCGRSRPDHFRGVLTVVAKLFNIVSPDRAVFGRKDFQQLVLIRRMTDDLDFAVEIVEAPIVREADGLAMSSRNRYLDADERRRARSLFAALRDCQEMFDAGRRDPASYRARMADLAEGVHPEYGEVVDPATLQPLSEVVAGTVCAIAARVGTTRLIDNLTLGTQAR